MRTVSQPETSFWDLLEAFQSVSAKLARFPDSRALADAALEVALELTGSSAAFIGLTGSPGQALETFSRAARPSGAVAQAEVERIMAAALDGAGPAPETIELGPDEPAGRMCAYCGVPLVAAGRTIGAIGIIRPEAYSAAERRAFSIFAGQVATGLELVRLEEHQRRVEDRAQSAERVEQAHEAAVKALLAVSAHARSGHDLNDFYRRLTASIAELVGARKVLFWQVDDGGMLTAIPGAYGIDATFLARLYQAPCAPDRDDMASRVVFHDHIFRASRADADGDFAYVLDALDVRDALAVCWRTGNHRLGLVAAYESIHPEGFRREDGWVLQKAALAAGLVWQLKHAESELKTTVERLERIDAARLLLLKNVSTAVDKARQRFASELHDDALQKLTAAELHLERLKDPSAVRVEVVGAAQRLLAQTEDALRRMLFEVRPPALEMPGGFEESIRDRVTMLRSMTGIEAEVDIDLPDELPYQLKATLFRQVTEALTNVERHAAAKRVKVSVKHVEGAVHGRVIDDGRGFVVAERDHLPGHLGLLALNERSVLAGGWTKIASEPGLGTTVEFWIPVE